MQLRVLLQLLTCESLRLLCRKRGIAPSHARKADLVEALSKGSLTVASALGAIDPKAKSRLAGKLDLPLQASDEALLAALPAGPGDPVDGRWRVFPKARAFVRRLELRGTDDWRRYLRGEVHQATPLPEDIPPNPHVVYRGLGWKNYRDWLGPGPLRAHRSGSPYWSFRRAREFARSLEIASYSEWIAYRQGKLRERLGTKPHYIPGSPQSTYSFDWVDWGDWLGTGRKVSRRSRNHMDFEEARDFARSLGLESVAAWRSYARGNLVHPLGPCPSTIPVTPDAVYRGEGWVSYPDWLGYAPVSFEEARSFARGLELRNKEEWGAFSRGERPDKGRRPKKIPSNPARQYPEEWQGWADFLGTQNLSWLQRQAQFWPFEKARAFARELGLAGQAEWIDWAAGRRPDLPAKPKEVPSAPRTAYPEEFVSTADWLGIRPRGASVTSVKLPFEEARAFVRALNLSSSAQWREYRRGERPDLGERPPQIPADPRKAYRGEFVSMPDWLGLPARGPALTALRWSFQEAREFARSLGLRSSAEWQDYSKGLREDLPPRPDGVPGDPRKAYRGEFVSMPDWLGYG